MGRCVRVVRGLALSCVVLAGILVGAGCVAVASSGAAMAQAVNSQAVNSIVVEGNRRVDADTVRTYFKPGPGGHLGPEQIDDALKALYATGLFSDVRINPAGGRVFCGP